MPLVNKQPFRPNPIPDNLGPNDEVFYHELTNEIFTSHDAYFDRFLYCNSLIWTCSKTGKSGLTYKEALDSEQQTSIKKKKVKRERVDETNGDGSEPVKKKKKKYPYDPKKYSMPVPEGFDPSLLTPTGKIDGRKLKSKKNKQIAEELLSHCPPLLSATPDTQSKKGKQKKKEGDARKREDEAKRREEEAKKKAQIQAELAKERELEAKRRKEAAALAKQMERQKKEEERKKAAAFLQNWEKKCDDLERDDLRRLPQPTPLNCDIPEKLFGDAVFILESLYNLHDLYHFEKIFPDGMSYDTLEEMLIDKQEEGPFGVVIQFLLRVIFDTQPTKDGYGLDDDPTKACANPDTKLESSSSSTKTNHVKTENTEIAEHDVTHENETNGLGSEPDEDDENEDKDVNMNDLIGSAIKAAQEVKKSLSKPLPEMEINSSNMTEILRLHLLQSGSFPKGRTIYNGWYSSREDPGLWLCMQEPDLIKKLNDVTLFDLAIEDRIKILHTLIYQLFSFIHTRTYIESASDSLTELRKQYRSDAAAFARWDRENCVKRMQPPINHNQQQHQQHKNCIKTNGTSPVAEIIQQSTNDDDTTTNSKKKMTVKTNTNEAIDNDNGLEDCENPEQNHDEKSSDSPTQDSGQTFEELERAYQQNMVDYADYQRERAIRHEQLSQDLLAIRSDIRHFQSIYGIHPIGRDRAYRRYWLFQSLPGLFVEQDDEFLGRCLPQPTPLESRYKKLFNKENPLMHPNESDLIRTKTCDVGCSTDAAPSSNAHEDAPEEDLSQGTDHFREGNEHESEENFGSDRLISEQQDDQDDPQDQQDGDPSSISDEMNYCTGDESSCAIHGQKRPTQPRWWFYHLPESIDRLLECLNKRGFRESELHDLLSTESSLIKPYIATCPAYKLNKFIYEQSGIRRSRRLRTKGSKKRGKNFE